jgi:hypothetical protein
MHVTHAHTCMCVNQIYKESHCGVCVCVFVCVCVCVCVVFVFVCVCCVTQAIIDQVYQMTGNTVEM